MALRLSRSPRVTRVHAAQDEAEQLPHLTAAPVRERWLAGLVAVPEGGNRVVDDLVLGTGENC